MAGWWGDSTVEVKYVAVVSTAGDPCPALAVEPDHHAVDVGVQLAAPAVVQVEGVQLGQQGHGPRAYRRWAGVEASDGSISEQRRSRAVRSRQTAAP
jgi:hypothetical protein